MRPPLHLHYKAGGAIPDMAGPIIWANQYIFRVQIALAGPTFSRSNSSKVLGWPDK